LGRQSFEDSLNWQAREVRIDAGMPIVIDVSAGAEHSIFVTDRGQAYSCGKGEFGQLCLGISTQGAIFPTKVLSN